MISRNATRFAVKPVVAAVALALSAAGAYAAPTPNQMPGARTRHGAQRRSVQVNGGVVPVGTDITGLPNGTRIDVDGQVVLHWGVTGGPARSSIRRASTLARARPAGHSAVAGGAPRCSTSTSAATRRRSSAI